MTPNTAEPQKTVATELVKSSRKDLRSHRKANADYSEYAEVIKHLVVHKQLLTSHSLFFRKALSGTWVEAKERKVKLPEGDHDTFNVYVNILYTDQITVGPLSSNDPKIAAKDELTILVDLYLLAEKLQDVKTKNKALVAVLAGSKEVRSNEHTYAPGLSIITKVYAGTTSGSVLRRLIMDLWTAGGVGQYLQSGAAYPTEFLHEVIVSLMDKRPGVPDLIDQMTLHSIWSPKTLNLLKMLQALVSNYLGITAYEEKVSDL